MSPTYISNREVSKISEESEAAMSLKPNSIIKSPMGTSNTSSHEVSKEKQREMSTPRWADMVDEEEHVSPLLLNRKLSPQALEFVPKSIVAKKVEQKSLTLEFTPTRVMIVILAMTLLMRIRKNICWIYALTKWLGMDISHLGIKQVEATKIKRRHMEGNTVGIVN